MKPELTINAESETLKRLAPLLHAKGEEILTKITETLLATDVVIFIEEKPEATIPETGVGGFTPDSNSVYVYVDTNNTRFLENPEARLCSTIAHEYHHAIRNRTIPWKTDTLLGAMVTEGLADHFDTEINGRAPAPWATALPEQEVERLLAQATADFMNRDYDHTAWFFGSEKMRIPKWTGYSLGFIIVERCLQRTGKSAAEAVSDSPESFI